MNNINSSINKNNIVIKLSKFIDILFFISLYTVNITAIIKMFRINNALFFISTGVCVLIFIINITFRIMYKYDR